MLNFHSTVDIKEDNTPKEKVLYTPTAPAHPSSQIAGQKLWRGRDSHKTGVQTDFYLTQGDTHGQGAWVRSITRRNKEEEDRLDDFYLLCGSVEISLEDYFNTR